ncbi:hypothetical protein LCGC14_1379280 [marine sediment metagenome]|uniref:Uncharacterized protein n=1 Tax=marine sediment metagenome TaxID=412755 RepID=A0A0F9N4S6_9ZZZZ
MTFNPDPPKRDKKVIPKKTLDPDLLEPNSPRQKAMTLAFKKIIAAHLQELEGKTTESFLDDLSLELWKATRK